MHIAYITILLDITYITIDYSYIAYITRFYIYRHIYRQIDRYIDMSIYIAYITRYYLEIYT